jgi:hypothetical protein
MSDGYSRGTVSQNLCIEVPRSNFADHQDDNILD